MVETIQPESKSSIHGLTLQLVDGKGKGTSNREMESHGISQVLPNKHVLALGCGQYQAMVSDRSQLPLKTIDNTKILC